MEKQRKELIAFVSVLSATTTTKATMKPDRFSFNVCAL